MTWHLWRHIAALLGRCAQQAPRCVCRSCWRSPASLQAALQCRFPRNWRCALRGRAAEGSCARLRLLRLPMPGSRRPQQRTVVRVCLSAH